MRLGVLKEFIYFWSFSITLVGVVFSRLYGLGLGNVSAFLCYMIFIVLYTKGAALKKIKFGLVMRLALLFFILAVGSIMVQKHISGSLLDRQGFDTYEFAINNLIITFIYFLFGMIAVFATSTYLKTKGILLVLVTLIFGAAIGRGVIDYEAISARIGSNVGQIEISQSFVVIVLLALAYSRRYKMTVIIIGSVLLFIAGSRTAFFLGAATMLFYAGAVGSVSRRMAVILGSILAMSFFLAFFDLGSNPLLSRMLLTEGFAGDSSAQSRLRQVELGFRGLQEQLIIGDMNFVVDQFGGIGFYIHNIFGYWQQYGGIVFFLVCLILFLICKKGKKDFITIQSFDHPFYTFRLLMLVYTILAVLVSMSYTFKFLWFMVGLYCVNVNQNKRVFLPNRLIYMAKI